MKKRPGGLGQFLTLLLIPILWTLGFLALILVFGFLAIFLRNPTLNLFDDPPAPPAQELTPIKPEIKTVKYTHDAMIDLIVTNPAISQNEIAKFFGYTPTWVSIIVNSDAFKNRLAERKAVLVDPKIIAGIEARLEGLAQRSLDLLIDRLDRPGNNLKPMELVAIAKLGVGDRNLVKTQPQTQNNLYVVNLPPPAPDAKTWVEKAQGRKLPDISDARVYE